MSYRTAAGTFLVLMITLSRMLGDRKNQTYTDPQKENSQTRPEKKPPGYRFRHYDHPTEEQHRTTEQFAWRTAKNLGVWTGVAASLAAVFAFWTWYETRSQANAAWDQARTAREALIDSNRAWFNISVDLSDTSLKWKSEIGVTLYTKVKGVNSGNSPSIDTMMFADLLVDKGMREGNPKEIEKNTCVDSFPVIAHPFLLDERCARLAEHR